MSFELLTDLMEFGLPFLACGSDSFSASLHNLQIEETRQNIDKVSKNVEEAKKLYSIILSAPIPEPSEQDAVFTNFCLKILILNPLSPIFFKYELCVRQKQKDGWSFWKRLKCFPFYTQIDSSRLGVGRCCVQCSGERIFPAILLLEEIYLCSVETKDDLEQLTAEIKKTANAVRNKLKSKRPLPETGWVCFICTVLLKTINKFYLCCLNVCCLLSYLYMPDASPVSILGILQTPSPVSLPFGCMELKANLSEGCPASGKVLQSLHERRVLFSLSTKPNPCSKLRNHHQVCSFYLNNPLLQKLTSDLRFTRIQNWV